MKITDLMIGDFVRIKSNVEPDAYFMHEDMYPGQVVKVEEILSNGINPDWMGGEVNDYLVEDAIEPIPLTRKLLEKNGFEDGEYRNYCGFVWKLKAEGFREIGLTISLKQGYLWGEKIKQDFPNSVGDKFNIPNIQYVHQLQHALRLCGIEKEIEL